MRRATFDARNDISQAKDKRLANRNSAELEIGAAGEWVFPGGAPSFGPSAGIEFTPIRKFGWFVEPSYDYSFGRGHEQSLGVTVGVLFAIP